jgi:hypothetical protein
VKHPLDHLINNDKSTFANQRSFNNNIGAQLLELVKFNCAFDENGFCARRRKFSTPPSDWDLLSKGCCCSSCARNTGFLNMIYSSEEQDYKKCWNNKIGFFKSGVGCLLPRKLRSRICQRYICADVKINKKDKQIINLASSLLCH